MAHTETDTDRWPTMNDDTLLGAPPPPPVAPPPPPPVAPGPDRRIGAGMLLALAVLALAAAGVAIAYFLTQRNSSSGVTTTVVVQTKAGAPKPVAVQKVAVPRVVGLKEQQALVRLAQLGLRPKEVYRQGKGAKDVVSSQKPQEARNVRRGTQVTIVINQGAPKVAVPDVSGKSLADAQAALDKLGLDSTITQVTSSATPGSVVDQAPKPGSKLDKGSVVTLSLAKPKASASPTTTAPAATSTTTAATTTSAAATPTEPQNATVPDVTSQKEAAAANALSSAGILPSLFFVPSSDPLGTVEQQAKAAGTTVPYHSHMQINVSSGPGDKQKVSVPNVVGQSLSDAVHTLNGAQLRLIYVKLPVSSRSQAGKIVQQSPLGGGSAPQNAQVLVFLGAFRG